MKTVKNKTATKNFVVRMSSELEDRIGEKIDEKVKKDEDRYNKVIEHLVDIAGKFKKFDEEQTLLSDKVIKHSDRPEELEKAVYETS